MLWKDIKGFELMTENLMNSIGYEEAEVNQDKCIEIIDRLYDGVRYTYIAIFTDIVEEHYSVVLDYNVRDGHYELKMINETIEIEPMLDQLGSDSEPESIRDLSNYQSW